MDNFSINTPRGLPELPVEVLYCIADELDYTWDISTLCLVNRRLYDVLNRYLYLFDKQYTPHSVLQWAVQNGRRPLVEMLLDDYVRDTPEGMATWSAVMQSASKHGHAHVAELLIEVARNTFPSSFPQMLQLELRPSIDHGHEPIVRLFLQNGALPVDMQTPGAAHCQEFNNLAVVKTLIEFTPPSSTGLAVLFLNALACPVSSTPEIVDLCFDRGADLATKTQDGKGLLHMAVLGRNPETVQRLLQRGVGLGLPGGTRLDPLMLALRIEKLDIARILLGQLNVDEILADGREVQPFLIIAAACGSDSIVKQLLQSGLAPDIFTPSSYPQTPGNRALVSAASFGHVPIARLLLEQGAKPHAMTLLCALEDGSVPMVKMLLEAGADPNYTNPHTRQSAWRVSAKDEALFALMLAHGAGEPPAHWPERIWEDAMKGGVAQTRMLLERREPPERNSYFFFSNVVDAGVPMLELLYGDESRLSRDDIRGIDNQPSLPLQAIRNGDLAAFSWLVKKGFSRILSEHDLCELLCALFVFLDMDDAAQGLDLLLEYGADINAEGMTGHRAIWVAMTYRLSKSALKVLLKRGANPRLWPDETPEHVAELLSSSTALPASRAVGFLLKKMLPVWNWDDMRELLSRLKSRADDSEDWRQVRILERFEYKHGFGFRRRVKPLP